MWGGRGNAGARALFCEWCTAGGSGPSFWPVTNCQHTSHWGDSGALILPPLPACMHTHTCTVRFPRHCFCEGYGNQLWGVKILSCQTFFLWWLQSKSVAEIGKWWRKVMVHKHSQTFYRRCCINYIVHFLSFNEVLKHWQTIKYAFSYYKIHLKK